MKIVDVYQPVESYLNGARTIEEYYDNKDEAQNRCNGIGISPEPIKRLGLQLEDGKVFLFESSTPVQLFHTTDEMKVAKALGKLTEEERRLLKL